MGFLDDIMDLVGVTSHGRPTRGLFENLGIGRQALDRQQSQKYNPIGMHPGQFRGGNFPRMRTAGEAGSGLRFNNASMEPPGPGIDDILARLEELQNPERYMQGMGDADSQAMAAASAQYDPLISALQRQKGQATQRANANKVELGRMFTALSGSLQGDIPAINKQYAGDKAATAKLYNDQKAAVKGQYDKSQQEQVDMMKQLGIEAAGATTLPQQQRDEDYFVNQAGQDNTVQQAALGEEQQGAVTYTREGSQLARTEGTQRQADLMAELRDLLAEYEGKIGEYGAAKQSAYIQGKGQLQSQMMSDAYDRADRSAENYLDMINLGRALKKDQFDMQGTSQGPSVVKSPADIAQRVLGMGLNNAQAQGIQSAFMSAVGSNPDILSGRDSTYGQSLPKEALANRVVEEGRRRHFSQQALNALQAVALEYFGRR